MLAKISWKTTVVYVELKILFITLSLYLEVNEGLNVVRVLHHRVDAAPPGQSGVRGVQGGRVADDVDRQPPRLHLPGHLQDVGHPLPSPSDQDNNFIGPKVLENLGHSTTNTGSEER